MTAFAVMLHLKFGLRLALAMLAVMGLLSWSRSPHASTTAERLRNATALLIALGVLLFSCTYLPPMLGVHFTRTVALTLEIIAVAEMCMAMIVMIAVRAILRGVSAQRVKRSMLANVGVVAALVAVAMLRQ